MNIPATQLQAHLRNSNATLWLVLGDEPLSTGEAADAIRQAARAAACSERTRISADHNGWISALYAALHNLSLLSSKRLVELDMRTGRISQTEGKELAAMLGRLPKDVTVLLLSKRPDAKANPPAWYTVCEKTGVVVSIPPIKGSQLPQWILQRAKTLQIPLSPASAAWLAERTEGNLPAAAQELEKLLLWLEDSHTPPTAAHIDQALRAMTESSARYDVFQLGDALRAGNPLRALHILSGLCLAGTEPALILWAITRELRLRGSQSRQSHLLSFAARLDRILKGVEKGNFREETEALLLAMTGRPVREKALTGMRH